MKTKAWSASGGMKKRPAEEQLLHSEKATQRAQDWGAPPEMNDDPNQEWRKSRPGQDQTQSAFGPMTAPTAGGQGPLQALLGDAARGVDEADLAKVVDASDVEKASAMGLTPRDVSNALQELQSAAVAEGRSPDSVDSLVALEALVTQERVLEDLERNEPGFDRQALTELSSPLRERESTRDEPDEVEKAEREMEMDAD